MKLGLIFFIVVVLGLLLLGIAYLLSNFDLKDSKKLSEYECGFEPLDNATEVPFDIHFYVVCVLFLIFDIEIALIIPGIIGFSVISFLSIINIIFFIVILCVGFLYEWYSGALI